MNNNWIEKGDTAFEAGESPFGMLCLKCEDMANWREMAMSRIKAVLSDRLLDFVKANPYITIGALFSRCYGVTQGEFNQFVDDVVALFEGSIPHLCSLDYGRSPRRNMIIVNFSKTTLSKILKKKNDLRRIIQ
jgi:hypothetical protein